MQGEYCAHATLRGGWFRKAPSRDIRERKSPEIEVLGKLQNETGNESAEVSAVKIRSETDGEENYERQLVAERE